MPLILGTNSIKDTGYNIANSCRFNDDDSAYLNRTQSSGSTTKFTYSAWMKRSTLSDTQDFLDVYDDNNNRFGFFWSSDDQIDMYNKISGSVNFQKITTAKYRDPSAWYHVVIAADTTDGTAEDRIKLWVNGVRVTSFGTNTNPGSSVNFSIHSSDDTQKIGAYGTTGSDYDGYMVEVFWIDGTAYANTDFGEFYSDSPTIWKPKDVSGLTFGTNGFYLPFSNSGALGDDESGNSNDFSVTNLAATDQSTDTPTNNFPTLNSLYKNAVVYSEGNLGATIAASSFESGITTFGASTSKWYCEFKTTAQASGVTRNSAGVIADTEADGMADGELGYSANSVGYSSTAVHKNSSSQSAGSWNSYTTNDIISVAMDLDNGFVYFAKNGTWENSGDPTSAGSGTGGIALDITSGYTYLFGNTVYASSAFQCNFGSPPYAISSGNADANGYGNFEYTVPSGYFAMNSKNLGAYGG